MGGAIRLQKFLSNAGIASRRKAEELITAGRVSVNGTIVTELGTRVDPERDRIAVDQQSVEASAVVWIALHKPPGYLTSRGDTHGRNTVYDLLPPEYRGLFYVGRLDYETEGLVLFTNDGDGAQRLQHPRFGVGRLYEIEVLGGVSVADVEALLVGTELDDGPARLLDADVISRARNTVLHVTIAEGRKREVRRLFNALGHEIVRLRRLRFGPIALGALESGAWRRLTAGEIAALSAAGE